MVVQALVGFFVFEPDGLAGILAPVQFGAGRGVALAGVLVGVVDRGDDVAAAEW